MSQSLEIELKDIVRSNISFGPNEIDLVMARINEDFSQFTQLRELTNELEMQIDRTPATSVRLGVCQYLLGRYRFSVETLSNSDGGALAYFYQGKAHFSLGNYDSAIGCYESAKTAGYDGDHCLVAVAEAKRHAGDIGGAMEILDNLFGPVEQTAEYLYQRGATVAASGDNPDEVFRLYERAVEIDGHHSGALFGLG